MKRAHIIFCLFFPALFGLLVNASRAQNQVRILTNVLPPYSPYIQDYPGTGNRVQVFISNLSGRDLSVRLLGKLEGDNGVVISTSTNYRPLRPIQLRATDINRMLTRQELEGLFDLAQIEVQGMNKSQLYRGLPLPEGNYQLCIQAFDNATTRPLSAEFPVGCSGLIPVRIVEPPILISPHDSEEIAAKMPQTQLFSWSAPVGILPNQVEYTLRIVELPAEANPNVYIDAMVLPRTGVEVQHLRTSTFLYGPSHPPLQFGKRYAWRVQAISTSQKLSFMNEGKSPVGVFTYGITNLLPGLEYIVMTAPDQTSPLRTKSMQVGSSNPLTFKWELDKELEARLRNAFHVPAQMKSILDHRGELSYQIRIANLGAKASDSPLLVRQVRAPFFQIAKEDLPAGMTTSKKFEVSVELMGVSDLIRKQAQLPNEPLSSKPVAFSLFAKDLGSPKDTLTITGILAFKYPGEVGEAHILPNTKVVLSKMEPGNYLLTVGYGTSDQMGRYTIKVLKSALHSTDTLQTFTRCVIDPVNPFVQPFTASGAYQATNDNTFQISRNEEKVYHVKGITWLAWGYTLDLTAKQSYKNWPGTPVARLDGQYVVIYRKTTGLQEYYKKFRLPVEGQIEKQPNSSVSGYNAGTRLLSDQKVIAGPLLTETAGATKTSGAAVVSGASENSEKAITATISTNHLSSATAGLSPSPQNEQDLIKSIQTEVEKAGYQFIGISTLKANGDVYSATFEKLVYADKPYDNYKVYCPGCGQKPDDGQAVIFSRPKDKLVPHIARIEKATFNIETTEPPTMTFKGKLAYRFADSGKDGAEVKALANTQVHLQVVYQDIEDGRVTAGIPGNGDDDIAAFHKNYSQTLDTKVTGSDGSFEFSVKMIKPMSLGILPRTALTGSGEFKKGGRIYRRTLRVVVDNEYYTSPTADFGVSAQQVMYPQGAFDFSTIIAKVKSYALLVQVKSDTTAIQKAGYKQNLFGIKISVLRAVNMKIGIPGVYAGPPADEGTGIQTIRKIDGNSYREIASGKSDVNGTITFPRMVKAKVENDLYFIATEKSDDGLNNYKLVSLKRITTNESWLGVYETDVNKLSADQIKNSDKIGPEGKKRTIVGGANINCRKGYKFRFTPAGGGTDYTEDLFLDVPEDAIKIAEYFKNKDWWPISIQSCQKADKYWIRDEIQDSPINKKILLDESLIAPTWAGVNAGAGAGGKADIVFADQYQWITSDVVQRYLKPGLPTVHIRVVDKSNPTQGIKGALVALSYEPEDGSLGNMNKMTDENGRITPFVLKPGKNAKVKVIAKGYNFYANGSSDNETLSACPGCTDCICIADLLLGQNSNYPAVLMQPNTHITGRAIDYDTRVAGTKISGVSVKSKAAAPINSVKESIGNPSPKVPTGLVANPNMEGEPATAEPGSGQSMQAYVQADDGYIFKTQFNDGMWKFDIDAPSTAQTLKIIPVNISYFNEERNIKTELPKPVLLSEGRFNINAGDIDIYQRDHRVTFKIFEKGPSGKGVRGAHVKLFGKNDPGFVFGPSDENGVVETQFKNVSTDNLYVEISAPGYVTQTLSVTNQESKNPKPKIVLLEPATVINGVVLRKSAQGAEIPLEGALVSVSAGKNASVKYSTVSQKDGSFSLDVDKNLPNCTVEASYNQGEAGPTYIGISANQVIPQAKGQSLKLTITTFEKFSIASLWGFPVTIEKIDPKTMKATGVVNLADPGFGPFGTLKDKLTARFENVTFKPNPDKPQEGIPVSETVELEDGVLDQLIYHTMPNIVVKDVKYNVKLSSLDAVASGGKLKITRTPGTSKGRILAQAQVIDNSFNFSENLFNPGKNQLFLSDTTLSAGKPVVVAFNSEKSNIKWTNFTLSQKDGSPMKLKFLAFNATSAPAGSSLIQDEIHLAPEIECHIKDAIPTDFKVKIGNLVIKNNTVDKKSGQTPLTFPLAGNWSVEIRDWELDFKKGGFYSTTGVVKTGKVDIPIKEFNLRSDFFKLDADPRDLELAGVAKLNLGGKVYFGYDAQTGSDKKGHWSMVIVPKGDSPAAKLPAGSLPGLTDALEFQTVSLLDNGQDVVSFGSGNKSFRYFNIIDVRPTTIETGPDWFAFDSGLSSSIPNAPKDVSMRFIYSKPKGANAIKLKTMIPGKYKFETSGYLNFEALNVKDADGGASNGIYFADGIIAMKGFVEEPEKLHIDNLLLIHTANSTHITHNRDLDLNLEKDLLKLKDNPIYAADDDASNKADYVKNQLSLTLEGKAGLSELYCHQRVEGSQWKLMTFSGLPNGFEMWKKEERNRLSFTAHGEIIADNQKIGLDRIPAPGGLGELSLVYDFKNSRLTGTLQMPPVDIPPSMRFSGGIGQVRVDKNGFYIVASGTLENVPLPVPTTLKAGLMLGYYNSRELSDATSVLFANSHRKSFPCSFSSTFKGIYATGEINLPGGIGNFNHVYGLPGAQAQVGVDIYADGYVYGNYANGALSFGAGLGVGAKAYAYGTLLSVRAGGEVYVNGGLDTQLTTYTSPPGASMSLSSNIGAGFKATLTEAFSGLALPPLQADMQLIVTGSATVGKGNSPSINFDITPKWTAGGNTCTSNTP